MRWASLLVLACLTGCASYQYDLVEPPLYAGALDGSGPRPFALDPLQYTVGTAEDRLSIQVFNPTGETVQLSGRESSVVDPDRRSHPLIDQTIAPQSYVRIVLPPLRPWAGTTGFVGGSPASQNDGGVSAEEQKAYSNTGHAADPGYDRASPVYWDWPGPGDVRVHLVYRRGDGSTFAHDLAFRRRKG